MGYRWGDALARPVVRVKNRGYPIHDQDTTSAGPFFHDLFVPKTSSTSFDLGVFVNDAAQAVTSADLKLI
jgi:hypothetical protein